MWEKWSSLKITKNRVYNVVIRSFAYKTLRNADQKTRKITKNGSFVLFCPLILKEMQQKSLFLADSTPFLGNLPLKQA